MANTGPIQNFLTTPLGQIKVQPKVQPQEPTEVQKDVVVLQPKAGEEVVTILTPVKVAARDLQVDPNTGEVPVEIIAVRKTPNLSDLKPAYDTDPVPVSAAPEGMVNVPTYFQASKEDVASGKTAGWQIAVLKDGETVAPKNLVADNEDMLLEPGTSKESAQSDAIAFKVPLPTFKNFKPGVTMLPVTRHQAVGMVDGLSEFAPLIGGASIAASAGPGFGAYVGTIFGPLTAYKGLQAFAAVGDSEKRLHDLAQRKGATELPFAVDPKTGKAIKTLTSKSLAALETDLTVAKRDAVGKIAKGGLLTAAGITALTGSPLAPYLAVGSVVAGVVSDGMSTKEKLALNKAKTEELLKLQAEGKTTATQEVPVKDYIVEDGRVVVDNNDNPLTQVVGTRKVELPIKDQLEQLEAERTQLQMAPLSSIGLVAGPAVSVLTGASMMTAGAVVGPFITTTMAVADGRLAYKLTKRRNELQSLKDSGQTTVKITVPVTNDRLGNISGSREVEVPIDGQIALLNQKISGATTQGAVKLGLGAGMGAVTLGGLPWVAGLGAIALPAGTYAYNQLQQLAPLKEQREHLRELQAKGETTFKEPQLLGDKFGNIAGIQETELPIADRLQELDKAIGKGHFKATAATTVGLTALGASAAAVAGAPIALVAAGAAAALVAIPAAAAFVFLPDQTSQFFSNAWDGVKSFGHKIADALRSLWPFGDKQEADPSPAPTTTQHSPLGASQCGQEGRQSPARRDQAVGHL